MSGISFFLLHFAFPFPPTLRPIPESGDRLFRGFPAFSARENKGFPCKSQGFRGKKPRFYAAKAPPLHGNTYEITARKHSFYPKIPPKYRYKNLIYLTVKDFLFRAIIPIFAHKYFSFTNSGLSQGVRKTKCK